METENPLKGGNDLELQRNSEGSQPTETKDDAEVRNVRFHLSSPLRFWSWTVNAKTKKHSNSIEIHWRDQDDAHKSGSVARKPCRRPLECRCGSKCGSSHYQNKNLQKIFTVKGTTSLHQLWPDISSDMSKAVQKKEKHEWTFWKMEGRQYAKILKMESARKPLRTQRKRGRYQWQKNPTKSKTEHGCIVEAHESTRKRLETTLLRDHEDHIAEKGFKSISHFNLVHKFFRCLKRGKILGSKAATKNERSSKSCQRGTWTKWRAKKDVSLEAPSKSPCCFIDGHLSSRKYWRPRSACCIHRAKFVCVSNDSCDSNGNHCRTVRLAADVVAASKQLKDSPRLLRIPKSECPGVYVFHDTNGQNHRQTLMTLNEIWSSIIRIAVWKTVRRSSIVIWFGKSIELGMSPRMTLVSTRGWHQNDWGTAQFGSHGMMKNVDLDESISFLDQRKCKPTEISVKEQQKNCKRGRNITQKLSRDFTIWKDMRKSTLRGIVS